MGYNFGLLPVVFNLTIISLLMEHCYSHESLQLNLHFHFKQY